MLHAGHSNSVSELPGGAAASSTAPTEKARFATPRKTSCWDACPAQELPDPQASPETPARKEYDLRSSDALMEFLNDADVKLVDSSGLPACVPRGLSSARQPRSDQSSLRSFTSRERPFLGARFRKHDHLLLEAEEETLSHAQSGHVSTPLILKHPTLPFRRQDAPKEAFADLSESLRLFAVSHAWETAQHPDPFGYQLHLLRDYFTEHDSSSAFFYDYTSAYQYRRNKQEAKAYAECMEHIHLLYAHEKTTVLRIEDLGRNSREADESEFVTIYNANDFGVQEVRVKELEPNRTIYHDRGWCQAECQWSSLTSKPSFALPVDCDRAGRPIPSKGIAPILPDVFENMVSSLSFTCRKRDANAIKREQRRVFENAAKSCTQLKKQFLASDQVATLAACLPMFIQLRELNLTSCKFTHDNMTALVEALCGVTQLTISYSNMLPDMLRPLAEAGTKHRTLLCRSRV